jgi:hypothetical protein
MRVSLVLAAMAMSTVAFSQSTSTFMQVGYAANLNVGDSVVNLNNTGLQGGFISANPPTSGNICASVYVFDPQEEEIGCCSCLITPHGLNSLSVRNDLISNNLTPAVPTSVSITILDMEPGLDTSNHFTVCNPVPNVLGQANDPYYNPVGFPGNAAGDPQKGALVLTSSLAVWGTTLEPAGTAGTYAPVNVPYFAPFTNDSPIPNNALNDLTDIFSTCNFIQANGTGFGICKSCRLGALGGAKQ